MQKVAMAARGAAAMAIVVSTVLAMTGAQAAEQESVALSRYAKPFGSIAVVDGDSQGWTAYGLGSPRDLVAAMAAESGCFTIQDPPAERRQIS